MWLGVGRGECVGGCEGLRWDGGGSGGEAGELWDPAEAGVEEPSLPLLLGGSDSSEWTMTSAST